MVAVREAASEDAKAATEIAFRAKASWGYPREWLAEWKPKLTFSPDYLSWHDGFVAEVDGEPVGIAVLIRTGDTFELGHLWVAPEAQGQGAGRKLLEAVRVRAFERGAEWLRIEADPNAVLFYERMGARAVGEVRAPVCGQDRTLPVMTLPVRRSATTGEALP